MSQGNRRRENGQGARPGDSTVRISAETIAALEQFRARSSWHATMSRDALLRELLQEKMHTPAPGEWPAPPGSRLEQLSPAIRASVTPMLAHLRTLPRELALTAVAIVYLRTLPRARALALVTMVLERLMVDAPEGSA